MKTCIWILLALVASRPTPIRGPGILNLHFSRGEHEENPRRLMNARAVSKSRKKSTNSFYYATLRMSTHSLRNLEWTDIVNGDTWDNNENTHKPYLKAGYSQMFKIYGKNAVWYSQKKVVFPGCEAQNVVTYENEVLLLEFGILDDPACLHSTNHSQSHGIKETSHPKLPSALPYTNNEAGLLSFSVWLGNGVEGGNELTLGGVNAARFKGLISLVPMVDKASAAAGQRAHTTSAILNSVRGPQNLNIITNEYVTFDTSSPISHLSIAVAEAIAHAVGAERLNDAYVLNCETSAHIELNFSGIYIPITVRNILVPHPDFPTKCRLPISLIRDPPYTLGTAFFKSMYLAFDFKRQEIGIALARTDNSTREASLLSMNNGIPLAIKAPFYYQAFP